MRTAVLEQHDADEPDRHRGADHPQHLQVLEQEQLHIEIEMGGAPTAQQETKADTEGKIEKRMA
ncbi:MAG: hypothetical protein M0R77_05520 [Gammaproteobacteria bacterium]|nr:hypothetical protein [Gammaproteobacteria bacterium]